jgi:hypothetical protein
MEKNNENPLSEERFDHLERRCPRLGGPVSFRYCRIHAGGPLPCWKVFECWWETFDIDGFIKSNLGAENYHTLVAAKPKPKIASLVELIAQTKKNLTGENPREERDREEK